MPGVRGHAWGNALGGWKTQRRVAGRFVPGHVGGFKSAIHSKTNTRQKRARIKRNAAIAGGAVVAVGAIAGGAYMIKSGKGKKLIQSVRAGQPNLLKHSGPSGRDVLGRKNPYHLGPVGAVKQAGRDIRTAGLHGTGIEGAVVGLQKMPKGLRSANSHLKAMTTTEGLDKTLHGAKAAAGVGGAAAAVSTAVRVTVGNTRAMITPEKPHVTGPRRAGRPKGSKNKAKEGASIAAEVTKGATHSKPPIVRSKGLTLSEVDKAMSQSEARKSQRANIRANRTLLNQKPIGNIRLKSKAARPSTLMTAKPQAAQQGVKVTEHAPAPKHTPAPPKGKTTSSTHKPRKVGYKGEGGSRVAGWGDPDRPGR